MSRALTGTINALAGLLVLLVIVAVVVVLTPTIQCGESRKSVEVDNLRSIVVLMISRRTRPDGYGYPAFSGKNFILSLVATGQLDRRNPTNLEVLWPPSQLSKFRALPDDAYAAVTKESLGERRFAHLTGYVGRRNADEDARIIVQNEKLGTPLVADVSQPDGVIIGWSNGAVRLHDWEELGMEPPDGPVVVGLKSEHPILRLLSDE